MASRSYEMFQPHVVVTPVDPVSHKEIERISGVSPLSPQMEIISVNKRQGRSPLVKVEHTDPHGKKTRFTVAGYLLEVSEPLPAPAPR